MPEPTWHIEPLSKAHDCQGFDCGHDSLSRWLREQAGQFREKDLARTYVATRPGESLAIGYYSLAAGGIDCQSLPTSAAKKLPKRMPIPTALLGKLAVDRSAQGNKLGRVLLLDAMHKVIQASDQLGIRLLVVDAIDAKAATFYQRFGFEPIDDADDRLFIPVATIRTLGL